MKREKIWNKSLSILIAKFLKEQDLLARKIADKRILQQNSQQQGYGQQQGHGQQQGYGQQQQGYGH